MVNIILYFEFYKYLLILIITYNITKYIIFKKKLMNKLII